MKDGARVVDAHQHFWDLEAGYDWLGPEYGAINRSFGINDVEPLAAEAGVDDWFWCRRTTPLRTPTR